jgi:hypothetical protein
MRGEMLPRPAGPVGSNPRRDAALHLARKLERKGYNVGLAAARARRGRALSAHKEIQSQRRRKLAYEVVSSREGDGRTLEGQTMPAT